jgi:putative hydrolase of the HAD superfamily
MRYTDLIFDLYGTLVDIHTEENDLVWEKTAFYFGFYGARYTPEELKAAFRTELKKREASEGQSYECFPDIPFEQVMESLFRHKGITENAEALGRNAAQLFRICSLDYVNLYPGTLDALKQLRGAGFRLWLLSNAQRVFTEYELRHLGLGEQLNGIYISSDYRCRKPDVRFFNALVQEQKLDKSKCLMIGNDLHTDIGGAKAAGLATFYMHTNLTPPDQRTADPEKDPAVYSGPHWEFEGYDWAKICDLIGKISG